MTLTSRATATGVLAGVVRCEATPHHGKASERHCVDVEECVPAQLVDDEAAGRQPDDLGETGPLSQGFKRVGRRSENTMPCIQTV